MNAHTQFNFANVTYQFRAKNGTVIFNNDGQILIDRYGWFDIPYQFFTRGPVLFTADEIEEIVIVEPEMVRGYMDFILKDKRKARVWLTRKGYLPYARKMKQIVEARMRKVSANNNKRKEKE